MMTLSRRDFLQGSYINRPIEQAIPANQNPNLHLLNRISWGARPEDVARINQIGPETYLDEQLNPEQLDDSLLEAKLFKLPILSMDRRTIYGLSMGEERTYRALLQAMLLRSVYSERQLLERVVEFWADHFNVPLNIDYAPDMLIYQRDVIRRHALGNFRDLLMATAKSPAMLIYLDNFVNIAEAPNENYARELLELHTLGVDGGYTEADIKEVSRAFTGWTTHDGALTGFYFDEDNHDTGLKQLLGHTLPADRGIEDGLHVLMILAHHPATAQFICRKLCQRFVSDTPPESLVTQLATIWQQHRGEIKPVLRALFLSNEFQDAAGAKYRRPLDFFVGALRATGTAIYEDEVGYEMLDALGQVPYNWRAPDGYPDDAQTWINTNGLLTRWNIAMALTHGAYSDVELSTAFKTALPDKLGTPQSVGGLVDNVALQVFGQPLADPEKAQFVNYASDGQGADTPVTTHLFARKAGSLYGLMLASPLYQWR
ncbi:MAG: DUF1800 domain-containing protein [Chloroflexota bacterium]